MIDVCVVHSSVSTGPEKDLRPKGPVIIYRLGGVGGFWAKQDEI